MRLYLILIFFLCIPAGLAAQATPESSPRLLVHLLDYVAQDYPGAVANGKILSASEYREQVEFTESAVRLASTLPETRADARLQTEARKLLARVEAKAPSAEVAELSQKLKARVIELSGLSVAPSRWPNLAKGRELFAKNCAACHGVSGHGDGPAAASLDPKPVNFFDEGRMRELSPFKAFNAIRVGVPGTAMTPFGALSDSEAWNLAFYVLSLRHEGAPGLPESVKPDEALLTEVATQSDVELARKDRRPELIAALRTHSGGDDGDDSLQNARDYLRASESDYRAGNADSAKQKALMAYLEGIEPIEPRLRANDPGFTAELEQDMGAVRSVIEARKPFADLATALGTARASIDRADQMLRHKGTSPSLVFLIAAGILLREGFEAVLIILALLAVIRASGSKKAALWVHLGWLSALALGLGAWFFSGWLILISGAQRELMEGITSLLAVIVLLYMGFWLHSKTELHRWKAFIHGQVKQAVEGHNTMTLAAISFMAVFREAFESVLFLRAAAIEGGAATNRALAAGVFGSIGVIILACWLILRYSARIPVRTVFNFSAVIMAGLAIILTGKGFHSLQETGFLTVTASPLAMRSDLFGLYPTCETLLSQAAVLLVVGALWYFAKKPPARQVAART